jgi:tRNA A-37 threonylcarbamoyl transferase component Bud32
VAVNTDIFPGRYRGPQQIGRGGMGEIYRATDTTLGRAVAIKILAERYAHDDGVRERFTREALAAARLSHERNTVTIYDVGEHLSRPFIVMEYLSGGSLDDVLRQEGAQPIERVFTWLEQAGPALDTAHREGVVHRDVKPANLLLDRHGNVHVADFGIASAAGLDSLTITGTVLGTAGYLSPEQAQGDRATAASDRYALAIVAFELLTGRRPFQADSPTAEASAHVHARVPSVCDRHGLLPCELDPVFERALAKNPLRRYATCAEFVAALRAGIAEAAGSTRALPLVGAAPTAATQRIAPAGECVAPPHASPRSLPRRERSLWPVLLTLLFVGALGGALAAGLLVRGDTHGAATTAPPKPQVTTVVRTVTEGGQTTTVREQVTTPAPTSTPQPSSPLSALSGHQLNDQGYARIQARDYAGALPLLQAAVQKLSGVGPGDPYEAYANFNLGYTLLQLGRCGDAVPYLQHAKELEPQRRPEPGRTLRRARACA